MDITNVRVLYLKGILFLLIGVLSGVVIILDHPTLKMAGLLAVCIWSFARAYYFAFYVIEHYVDRTYRFAGLGSFLRYALKRGSKADK